MADPYRSRSDETWDKARADYLAGETAERVCDRYGLGESNFRKRAREDRWRKCDQPDPEPLDDDDDLPHADLEVTADLALRRMAASVRRGRAAEALRWQRLHAGLSDRLRAETRRSEAQRRYDEVTRADQARELRLRASLPSGASRTDYLKARLDEIMEYMPLEAEALRRAADVQKVQEVQEVQEVQCDSDPAPDPGSLNRSERRRLARMARQRS